MGPRRAFLAAKEDHDHGRGPLARVHSSSRMLMEAERDSASSPTAKDAVEGHYQRMIEMARAEKESGKTGDAGAAEAQSFVIQAELEVAKSNAWQPAPTGPPAKAGKSEGPGKDPKSLAILAKLELSSSKRSGEGQEGRVQVGAIKSGRRRTMLPILTCCSPHPFDRLEDHLSGEALRLLGLDGSRVPDHCVGRGEPMAWQIIGSVSVPASQASTRPASSESPEPIGFRAWIAGGIARYRFSRTCTSAGLGPSVTTPQVTPWRCQFASKDSTSWSVTADFPICPAASLRLSCSTDGQNPQMPSSAGP